MGVRIAKWQRRATKRAEAKQRQEARNKRSDAEQIALILDRPGASKKEIEKIWLRGACPKAAEARAKLQNSN